MIQENSVLDESSNLDNLAKKINSNENEINEEQVEDKRREELKKQNFMLNLLPEIFTELSLKNIEYKILNDGSANMGDFYKKGECYLICENGKEGIITYLVDKKKQKYKIEKIDDILLLYYQSWNEASKNKNTAEPQKYWLDLLIEKNWVEKIIVYKPKKKI